MLVNPSDATPAPRPYLRSTAYLACLSPRPTRLSHHCPRALTSLPSSLPPVRDDVGLGGSGSGGRSSLFDALNTPRLLDRRDVRRASSGAFSHSHRDSHVHTHSYGASHRSSEGVRACLAAAVLCVCVRVWGPAVMCVRGTRSHHSCRGEGSAGAIVAPGVCVGWP